MKTTKILKVSMLILLIVLISLVSFFGVYTKGTYKMENLVRDYTLGMDLIGTRLVQFKPGENTNGTNMETTEITTDLDLSLEEAVNEVTNDVEDNTIEETEIKSEEKENKYVQAKKIFQDRLKALEVSEYRISVDKETGVITMELPENTLTDEILDNIYLSGDFEISDAETKEVLLNNDDIKTARVAYYNTDTATAVYVSIKFDSQGAKKLEEISKIYVQPEEELAEEVTEDSTVENEVIDNTVEENVVEEINTETAEENTITDETVTEETSEEDETEETKQVTLKFNGEEYVTTYFSEPMTTGELQLTIGDLSADMETIQENLKQASMIAVLLDNGNLPVGYTVSQNQYIEAFLSDYFRPVVIAICIMLVTTLMVYLIIEYKEDGIVASILFYGFIATLLLLIRYVDVTITTSSIFGIVLAILLEYIYLINLCKRKGRNNYLDITLLKYIKYLIPALIFAIIFIFVKTIAISSLGIAVFWGIILFIIYNYIFTKNIIDDYVIIK